MPRRWVRVLKKQPRHAKSPAAKFARAIHYHWRQARSMYVRMARDEFAGDKAMQNAVLEQFLIHSRVIVDAFYDAAPTRTGDLDVTAVGLRRTKIPAAAKHWRDAVNKRAAHLTDRPKVSWSHTPVLRLLTGRMNRLRDHLLRQAERRDKRAVDALKVLEAMDREVTK